jgi:hypothetical protein
MLPDELHGDGCIDHDLIMRLGFEAGASQRNIELAWVALLQCSAVRGLARYSSKSGVYISTK